MQLPVGDFQDPLWHLAPTDPVHPPGQPELALLPLAVPAPNVTDPQEVLAVSGPQAPGTNWQEPLFQV